MFNEVTEGIIASKIFEEFLDKECNKTEEFNPNSKTTLLMSAAYTFPSLGIEQGSESDKRITAIVNQRIEAYDKAKAQSRYSPEQLNDLADKIFSFQMQIMQDSNRLNTKITLPLSIARAYPTLGILKGSIDDKTLTAYVNARIREYNESIKQSL